MVLAGAAMKRVLVADDEENIRLVLTTVLKKAGYEVEAVASAEEALTRVSTFDPDFVLADVRMGGMTGIELCTALRARGQDATVIIMSAYGSLELALDAMKAGAYDYVAKPFKRDEVLLALRKAEERETLRRENKALREAIREQQSFATMLGKSEAMRRVFRVVEKVAGYDTTVLIQGESGTGKELIARALHDMGGQRAGRFVPVNCGAIPGTLLETELFGHKKGAFTDARADKRGLFEEADGGTLFLDEIGELPLALQVKLLRVLQEGTIRPVGDVRDKAVKVRVVAATVRDLEHEVKEGRFREDLFYRLNVLQIVAPPLRERAEDVLLLAEHFIARCNSRLGTDVRGLDAAAKKRLVQYPFPGNVRELENLIERAVVLTEGQLLTESDLPDRVREPTDAVAAMLASGELSIKKTQRFIEESLIRKALEKTQGNRTQASKLLEISHRALLYKIKDYGLG
jgi:two-component system response regulator AtoC